MSILALPCSGEDPTVTDRNTDPDYSLMVNFMRRSIPNLMKGQDVPGLSIVLVDTERILWAEGFGFADPEEKVPVTAETMFSIQSISKTITATAVMTAVQEGLVDLDAPITRYLPDFTVHSRFAKDPQEKMTLRRLLSHTAGLAHIAPAVSLDESSSGWLHAEAKCISETWLRFPVGQRYSYSNLGLALAGYVLERVTGRPFEQYVKETVLDRLGMQNSSFDVRAIWKSENRAVGYGYQADEGPPKNMVSPAGGCYTNALGMARLIRFHLSAGTLDGREMMGPALVREMHTIPFPVKGQVEGYALGISRLRTWGYRVLRSYYLEHTGAGDGFHCTMRLLPEYGLGAAVLTRAGNSTLSYNLVVSALTQALQLRTGTLPATSPYADLAPCEMTEAAVRRLYGNYIGRDKTLSVESREDVCRIRLGNGKFLPAHFVAENEVFVDLSSTLRRLYRVSFGDDGLPRYVVLVNNGDVFDYNDGPNDKPGPNNKGWDTYPGTYAWKWNGQRRGTFEVRRKNGYVYFGDTKLHEFQPGFFFTADGDVVNLRDSPPTWRNLELERIQ